MEAMGGNSSLYFISYLLLPECEMTNPPMTDKPTAAAEHTCCKKCQQAEEKARIAASVIGIAVFLFFVFMYFFLND
jgi:hypothetical protein